MWRKFANVIPALEIQHAVVQLRFISRLFGLHLFSLCFSGRKFLINLRRQFRVHNFFSPGNISLCGVYSLFICV